jgi:hypothetical protein
VRQKDQRWTVSRDLVGYASELRVLNDLGTVRLDDIDLELTRRVEERYRWAGDDFQSPRGDVEWHLEFARGDWHAKSVTRTVLSCTSDEFHLHAALDAYEGEERVYSRNWHRTIPRDHV